MATMRAGSGQVAGSCAIGHGGTASLQHGHSLRCEADGNARSSQRSAREDIDAGDSGVPGLRDRVSRWRPGTRSRAFGPLGVGGGCRGSAGLHQAGRLCAVWLSARLDGHRRDCDSTARSSGIDEICGRGSGTDPGDDYLRGSARVRVAGAVHLDTSCDRFAQAPVDTRLAVDCRGRHHHRLRTRTAAERADLYQPGHALRAASDRRRAG